MTALLRRQLGRQNLRDSEALATAPVCDVNSVAAADRAPLLPATRADATSGSNFSEVSSAAAQISYNLNSVIGYDINSAVNNSARRAPPPARVRHLADDDKLF